MEKKLVEIPSAKENNNTTTYSAAEQNMLFDLEGKSWWFQYRAKVILHFLSLYFDDLTTTVDIGGGNGYTSYVAMKRGFQMELLEPSQAACDNAERRGLKAVCNMLSNEYPTDGCYKQVMLLDVLEHIEDDEGFLNLLKEKMSAGGELLITVPAFMSLWNSQDEYAGHFRRYDQKQLALLLERSGFEVQYINYFFSFLFFPHLFGRRVRECLGLLKRNENRTEEEQKAIISKQFELKQGSFVKRIIEIFEKAEFRRLTLKRRHLLGSSVIAIARCR